MGAGIRANQKKSRTTFRFATGLCMELCIAFPSPSRAASTPLKVGMSPTTGASMQVHPRVQIATQMQLRFTDLQHQPMEPAWYARLSTLFISAPILALECGYAYSHSFFPIDTTFRQEHRILLGAILGTRPRDGFHLSITNRTRLENRIVSSSEKGLSFLVRPRNETQLALSFLPELQLSWTGEALFEPKRSKLSWLQIRTGLFVHGNIPIGRHRNSALNPGSEAKRKIQLNWLVGDYIGFRPLTIARKKRDTTTLQPGDEALKSTKRTDSENLDDHQILFMVLTFGLSASF